MHKSVDQSSIRNNFFHTFFYRKPLVFDIKHIVLSLFYTFKSQINNSAKKQRGGEGGEGG